MAEHPGPWKREISHPHDEQVVKDGEGAEGGREGQPMEERTEVAAGLWEC